MSIGSRIKERREELKITQVELSKMVGVSKGSIGNYESGVSAPNEKILYKLFTALKCDANYLYQDDIKLNGADNELKFSPQEKDIIKKYRTLDEYGKKAVDGILTVEHERCEAANADKFIILPFSQLKASAGTGEWLSEESTDTVRVLDTPQARKADIVIEVSGTSMEPLFSDGDRVLVRKQPAVNEGEVGIFIINHTDGFIKEFAADRLISVNPEWDDIYPSEDKIIECIGKVVGLAITYE